MSPSRRGELLAFSARTGAVIVEDDYDGEFRYDGSPLEALRGSDSASRVFYVGSFSKCMFPALRLGFLVSPQWAMPALVAAMNATDWHSSVPVQAAVAGFIQEGHLTRHIRKVRRIYRERRRHLLSLLERLGDRFAAVPSFYGMHRSVVTRRAIDCEAVGEALAERGIMIHSLRRYFLGAVNRSGFVLGYAASDQRLLDMAISALVEELPV
jgi:GntR family transcriptional regulator/MocR family aminotransferase